MGHLGRAALLLCATLAACQPAASGAPSSTAAPPASLPSASAPVTGSADPGATPAATPAAMSSTRLTLTLEDAPFLGPEDGPANARYVMPAAGTRDRDGNLVLVLVWFGAESAPPEIAIARSADGNAWEVGSGSLLAGLEIGFDDPGPIPTAISQLEDGTWQLYGSASADSGGRTVWSWRTSAPKLDGPWSLDATELLPAGPAGAWDSFMTTIGPVQRSEDGYLGWFEGEPPGRSVRGDIGLATSPDGLAWTKHDDPATVQAPFAESDPVISTAICGAASEVAVEQPQVERVGDRYVALFGGFSATSEWLDVLAAVSDDGRGWQCASPEPLLAGASLGSAEGIHTMASIPLADGRIGLVLEGLAGSGSALWWATAEVVE